MTYLLPYIEQHDIYDAIDLAKSYRDTAAGGPVPGAAGGSATVDGTAVKGNVWAATHTVPTFVCPSNPFNDPLTRDPAGFGGLDYFATVYTDIDATPGSATLGARNKNTRMEGALAVDAQKLTVTAGTITRDSTAPTGVRISAVSDGTSNTIAVIEDAGRVSPLSYNNGLTTYFCASTYVETLAPSATLPHDITGDASGTVTSSGTAARAVWRWADPDANGSGVSGPFGDTASAAQATAFGNNTGKVINQNNYPIGGPVAAPGAGGVKGCMGSGSWCQNNCGCNDEPFSFHQSGCNAVMVDGSVRFLSDNLDPITLRRLVTRSEGIPIDNGDAVFGL
jgi:prepilin-type processing-associated H-X9-DG protein